jgi:hypothetical protein
MIIEAATTPITIEFPNWFYGVFSVGVVVFIFWAGYNWCKINEMCGQFPKIRRALDIISGCLLAHKWVNEHIYVSSGSPLQLTEAGKKMLADSGFEQFFAANKHSLFAYITSKKAKSVAEIETAAREAVLYLDPKNTPKMELIEDFSYKNGRPIGDVLFAYSVEVRDRYLKDNPV